MHHDTEQTRELLEMEREIIRMRLHINQARRKLKKPLIGKVPSTLPEAAALYGRGRTVWKFLPFLGKRRLMKALVTGGVLWLIGRR